MLASVYIECSAMYRRTGPQALRPVGEAEFAAGMAAMSESGHFGPTRICAAFVGAAVCTLGEGVDEVLDALAVASGGRLRGIRGAVVWDADPSWIRAAPCAPQGLLGDVRFPARAWRDWRRAASSTTRSSTTRNWASSADWRTHSRTCRSS